MQDWDEMNPEYNRNHNHEEQLSGHSKHHSYVQHLLDRKGGINGTDEEVHMLQLIA